jgi:peptidoglycan/xylan/chitin deacetylase (PgdA/CDA1 family)
MHSPNVNPGGLVISLDFELHWGVRDHSSVADYRENLLGAREAIPAMLRLFEKYGIHATWATVGMLFCENKQELLASAPALRPEYRLAKLSPYLDLDSVGEDEVSDPFHYAPSLIRTIASAPGQELGTHTFSHFYCLEEGATVAAFEADLEKALQLGTKLGVQLKSLVFPRNQYGEEHLHASQRCGITCVRSNQQGSLYNPRASGDESLFRRGLRLADAYVNLSGHNTHSSDGKRPARVPASRFLRPYNPRLCAADSLRMRRILHDLDAAAECGEIYHLWWHPHNFGRWTRENLEFLEAILRHLAVLRDKKGFASWTMLEAAETGTKANRASQL